MILGIDISKYQIYNTSPFGSFEFDKAHVMGARWYIKRVGLTYTWGVKEEDPRWKDYEATNGPLLDLGRYHPIRLEYNIPAQIDDYKKWTAGYDHKRVWVDLEGKAPGTLTPNEAARNLGAYLDAIEKYTGITPGIYTRQNWFDPFIAPSRDWKRYPLWIARYPGYEVGEYMPKHDGPSYDGNYVPRDWGADGWAIWQYTDDGPGIQFGAQSQGLDCNVFNGNAEDLERFAGSETVPEPGGDEVFEVINPNGLNVRSGPGLGYSIQRVLKYGDRVGLVDLGGRDCWVEIEPGRFVAFQYGSRRYLKKMD